MTPQPLPPSLARVAAGPRPRIAPPPCPDLQPRRHRRLPPHLATNRRRAAPRTPTGDAASPPPRIPRHRPPRAAADDESNHRCGLLHHLPAFTAPLHQHRPRPSHRAPASPISLHLPLRVMDAMARTVSSPDSFPLQPAPPPTSGATVVQAVQLRRLRPCNSACVSARRSSAASPLRDGSFTSRSPCAAPTPPQPTTLLPPCPQPATPLQSRPQPSAAPAPSGEVPCLGCLVPLATGSVRRPFSPELLLRRQGRAGSCHPCRPQPPSACEKQLIAGA